MVPLEDLVDCCFQNHPADCIFAPGARERIIERMRKLGDPLERYTPSYVDEFERAFKAEEIYCPHEGIDRRAEFGISV